MGTSVAKTKIVQVVMTQDMTYRAASAHYSQLDTVITPTTAGNYLYIEASIQVNGGANFGWGPAIAIYKDSDVNPLAVSHYHPGYLAGSSGQTSNSPRIDVQFYMLVGARTPITFKVYCTSQYGSVNYDHYGLQQGLISSLKITELGTSSSLRSFTTLTQDTTARTFTAPTVPMDNSLPQSNEGAEYTQLQTVYTPKSASSTLILEARIAAVISAGNQMGAHAFLFKNSDANCLAGGSFRNAVATGSGGGYHGINTRYVGFMYKMTNSALDPITFKIRCGETNGSLTVNKDNGGLSAGIGSTLKITEFF